MRDSPPLMASTKYIASGKASCQNYELVDISIIMGEE